MAYLAPGNRESGKILSCVILSLSFLSGSILGAAAAGRMTESGAFDLYDAILRYTLAAKSGTLSTSFTAAFARCFGAIAFAAAMGLTSYCILIVPLVFAFKGFSFSYIICAFCAILGKRNGLLVSLAVCGLRNIFVIFGLVVLSADIYAKTLEKQRRRAGFRFYYPDKEYMLRTLFAFASAGAALLCDLAVVPALVSAVSGFIP